VIGAGAAALSVATLAALKAMRAAPETGFELGPRLTSLVRPAGVGDGIELAGVLAFGLLCGLGVAAVAAARRRGSEAVREAPED
jgi:hypothetical protein